MNLLTDYELRLSKGIGYILYFMLTYKPFNDSELKEYINYCFEYHPEKKILVIHPPEITGSYLKKMDNEIKKLTNHLLAKYQKELNEHNLLCDKVYNFLNESEIDLDILSVEDIRGDKVRFMIKSKNIKHNLSVNIGMKDKENMSHFYIENFGRTVGEGFFVSFNEPYYYKNIMKTFHRIIEESEFRLKFLLDEEIS